MSDEFSRQRRTLRRLAVALGVLLFGSLGWSAWHLVHHHAAGRYWIEHTHEVVGQLDVVSGQLAAADAAAQAYVLTGADTFRTRQRQTYEDARAALDRAAELTRDNQGQQERAATVRKLVARYGEEMAELMALRGEQGTTPANARLANSRALQTANSVKATVQEMRKEEERLLAIRAASLAETRQFLYALVAGLVLCLGVLTIVVIYMILWTKRLQAGLVTVCAWTRQVKLDGRWVSVEEYLEQRFGIRVSHGISEQAAAEFEREVKDEPPIADR